MPFGGDQDVTRFDVAMDQAKIMGVLQTTSGLRDHQGGILHAQSAMAANEFAQVGARHIFGHQVMHFAILSGIVGTDNIGAVQTGLQSNLAFE